MYKDCALYAGSFCHSVVPCALVLIILIVPAAVVTAKTYDRLFDDNHDEPWHIVADKISYDQKAGRYIAEGDAVITKEDRRLAADFIRFDHKTMEVLAVGNVIMTIGEDILTGSSMEMNLKAETGTLYDGTVFLKTNHFYIRGDRIQKTGRDSYAADSVSITTCDGDQVPWKITGRNLRVTIEGYGFANHATLWVKNMPVLYTPFLVFPVKLKRQSGLLTPQIGYSERKGKEYAQPFYWAIDKSSDATFYLHHMGKRGNRFGLEYRYVLDDKSKGALVFSFLNDEKVDDTAPGSTRKWGYEDDDLLRPNSDRYWFRMKHDQALPFGFSAKLDIDIVSDQDYLREFKDGYMGFDETEEYFIETFGRGFDEYDDTVRVNRLNLSRSWSRCSLNIEMRWYDDVTARRWKEMDTTLHRLPFIEFDVSRKRVLKTPFYFTFDSEYTYFFRKDLTADQSTGHRIDVHPRFYLPLRFRNYFTFTPSLGVRWTAWYIDEYKDTTTDMDRMLSREIYDIKLGLSSDIFNIYHVEWRGIDQIRHVVTPQIVYDFIPCKDQDRYSNFDALDRIERRNLLTYSLTSTLTSRTRKITKKDEPVGHAYHQFCRFMLEQSYDINKGIENEPEPFSPIYGEIELIPTRHLSMKADAKWCRYKGNFLSYNIAASILDRRGSSLSVEYRYRHNLSESVYMDLSFIMSDHLTVYAEYERDIYHKEDIKIGLGFLYEAQCWSIDFRWAVEDDDHRYTFTVNLYGLGGIGGRI